MNTCTWSRCGAASAALSSLSGERRLALVGRLQELLMLRYSFVIAQRKIFESVQHATTTTNKDFLFSNCKVCY